jgi:hypothetical protein
LAYIADGSRKLIEGSRGCGAQVSLKFGEGHLDGIEVGTVGRPKECAEII